MTCDVTGAHKWEGVRESKWPNCKYAACGWLFAVHTRNLGYCYVKFLPKPSECSCKRHRMLMSANIHYARDVFFKNLQMPGQSPCWSCTDSNACQESITTVMVSAIKKDMLSLNSDLGSEKIDHPHGLWRTGSQSHYDSMVPGEWGISAQ